MKGSGRLARTSSTTRKLFLALTAASSLALAGCTLDSLYEDAPETGASVALTAEGLFGSGKKHLEEERFGLALESFKAALSKAPGSVRTLNAIGVTYDKLGRADIAEGYYRRALGIDPESVQTINNLGYSLLLQGRAKEALPFLAQAAKADDNHGQSLIVASNYQMALKAAGDMSSAGIERASLPGYPETSDSHVCTVAPVWLEKSGERVYTLITEPSAAAAAAMYQLSTGSSARAGIGGGARSDCAAAVRNAFGVVPRLNPGDRQEKKNDTPWLKAPVAPDRVVSTDPNEQAVSEVSKRVADAKDQPTVDVSNGAGRNNLAARVQQYFKNRGLQVDRITNAASFDHGTTVIFYRDGYEKKAKQYSEALPTGPKVEMVNSISTDLRVLLGRDILTFDSASLLHSNKKLSFLAESGS